MLQLIKVDQGCQPVFIKKSQTLSQKSQKKPDSSFKAYTHKTCIIKHKVDIKTRQKHRYSTLTLFGSIFYDSVITLSYICFLSIILTIFKATVKFFQYCVHPAWLYLFSEEICNEYATQKMFLQSQAFLNEKSQILSGFFYFPKKPKVLKKPEFQNLASKKSNWEPWSGRVSSRFPK